MAKAAHKHSHYFEILSFFALTGVTILVVTARDRLTLGSVTVLIMSYFALNLIYLHSSKQLTALKVVEAGLLAFISEVAIINLVI